MLNTVKKLDFFLKLKHGFIEDTITFGDGTIQYIPKSLSYATAGHTEATDYISKAMVDIAEYLGVPIAELKQGMQQEYL